MDALFGKRMAIARRAASYEDALAVADAIESHGGRVTGVTVFGQQFEAPNPAYGRKAGVPKTLKRIGTAFAVFATVRGERRKRAIDMSLLGRVQDLQAAVEQAIAEA